MGWYKWKFWRIAWAFQYDDEVIDYNFYGECRCWKRLFSRLYFHYNTYPDNEGYL